MPPLKEEANPVWKNTSKHEWDSSLAEDLLGQLVLIGLTYLSPDGEILEKTQGFGHVVNVDHAAGIKIKFKGQKEGETLSLPPDTTAFERASPGIYKLKSTGEAVEDPAFLTSYTITRAKSS